MFNKRNILIISLLFILIFCLFCKTQSYENFSMSSLTKSIGNETGSLTKSIGNETGSLTNDASSLTKSIGSKTGSLTNDASSLTNEASSLTNSVSQKLNTFKKYVPKTSGIYQTGNQDCNNNNAGSSSCDFTDNSDINLKKLIADSKSSCKNIKSLEDQLHKKPAQ